MLKKKSDKMKAAIKKIKKPDYSFDAKGNIILSENIKKPIQKKHKHKTKNNDVADMMAQIRAGIERE